MMNTIIKSIFKEKSTQYQRVINKMNSIGVEYIIYGLYDYDRQGVIPGDLDIIIPHDSLKIVNKCLSELGFFFYVESQTGQYQWLRLSRSVGIIQIHIHCDFCFYGQKIMLFENFIPIKNKISFEEEYAIFLVSLFYKNNYNKKTIRKGEFLQRKASLKGFKELNLSFSKKNIKIIGKRASSKICFSWYSHYYNILSVSFWPSFLYLVKKTAGKIVKVIKSIFKTDDISIIFMGVDGAGKSTCIENIRKSLGGEVAHKSVYFGLKSSLVYKVIHLLKGKKSSAEKSRAQSDLSFTKKTRLKKIYHFFIALLYWLEYNFKYLFLIRLNAANIPTINLIDRSYYDALLYYSGMSINKFFMQYTFRPSLIVYLTGETRKLWERKYEISIIEINTNKDKYNKLFDNFDKNGFETLVLDSTDLSEDDITSQVLSLIFNKIKP
jgi:hypothetical protein